jgi:hypothetical protein
VSLIHTRLDTATGSILDRDGTSRNVLDSLSDARPVTESDKGNVLVLAPGNKIYKVLFIGTNTGNRYLLTLVGLGKQQIGLLSR